MEEREIRAVYTEETIRVYQAYNKVIAEEAVKLGTFGPHFKLERMTWIKPSFLWMMYRCGWCEKENQEHVLAIDMKREAFDQIVAEAVLSTYNAAEDGSFEAWQNKVKASQVRCQWDPEKDISGNNLAYRSIQLGLRGQAVRDYVEKWIVHIEDISDYVKDLNAKRKAGIDITALLPKEEKYTLNEKLDPAIESRSME